MSIREKEPEVVKEYSMVDLFHVLLKEAGEPADFDQLFDEIAHMKGFDAENNHFKARLFTEINIDGRFKPLGDNLWGLRMWYPVDNSDDPVVASPKKKKKAKRKGKEEDWNEDWAKKEVEPEDVLDEDLEAQIEEIEDLDEDLEEEEMEDGLDPMDEADDQ